MRRGELLEVVVDDPRSEADLPRAAEAAGHAVLEVLREGAAIRILIEI
jgi:TusA-related sulfurtransferase